MTSMNESVLKYLREQSFLTKERLTAHFSAEVEEFSLLLSMMMRTLQHYHAQNPAHDFTDAKAIAFRLMTKSASTLTAAFELTLSGYLWEPPALLRNALEGFAVGWDVVHNKDRLDIWNADKKFDSSDSISNAKLVVSYIGKMYGHMSNMNVHTKPLNSWPSMLATESGAEFQFFGQTPPGKEAIRKGEIYSALIDAHICLNLTELVFHNYSPMLETIEKIPGTDTVRFKATSTRKSGELDESAWHDILRNVTVPYSHASAAQMGMLKKACA